MKAIAVVAALVCLVAGFAIGYSYAKANAQMDVNETMFARSLSAVSSSTNTLMFLDARRADQIQAFQEEQLRSNARMARANAPAARHAIARLSALDQVLARATAYAQKRGMKDTVADLNAVGQTLHAMAAAR